MTLAGLTLWTLGVAAIAFTLGWSARDRKLRKRKADLDDLRMLLTSHVETAEFETIARTTGAV